MDKWFSFICIKARLTDCINQLLWVRILVSKTCFFLHFLNKYFLLVKSCSLRSIQESYSACLHKVTKILQLYIININRSGNNKAKYQGKVKTVSSFACLLWNNLNMNKYTDKKLSLEYWKFWMWKQWLSVTSVQCT